MSPKTFPLKRTDLKRGHIYMCLQSFTVHPDRGETTQDKTFPTIYNNMEFMVLDDVEDHYRFYSDYYFVKLISVNKSILGYAMFADYDRFAEVSDDE